MICMAKLELPRGDGTNVHISMAMGPGVYFYRPIVTREALKHSTHSAAQRRQQTPCAATHHNKLRHQALPTTHTGERKVPHKAAKQIPEMHMFQWRSMSGRSGVLEQRPSRKSQWSQEACTGLHARTSSHARDPHAPSRPKSCTARQPEQHLSTPRMLPSMAVPTTKLVLRLLLWMRTSSRRVFVPNGKSMPCLLLKEAWPDQQARAQLAHQGDLRLNGPGPCAQF